MLESVSASATSRDATFNADKPSPAGARRGGRCRIIGAAVCAMLAVVFCSLASEPAPAQPHGASAAGYFVDFRSRPAYLFGHSFIVYGRLDNRGKPVETHLAGIYPIDGQAGLIMGSAVFPVRASVRAVHGDYQERPSNIYRRRLTSAQYTKLLRVVGGLRRSEREWNLLFKNCNDFAIEVAKGMGMTTPPSWLPPYYFVAGLRALNRH
jgi:hypothetical protein